MNKHTTQRNQIKLALSGWRNRFRRARPGSVLILVIALLVLMALIGTAFISTAHVERYSATQNTYNTQVDLLVQGVLNMAQGPMIHKLQGNVAGGYRIATSASVAAPDPSKPPPNPNNYPDQYNCFDSSAIDTYLADRYPSMITQTSPPSLGTPLPSVTGPGWVNSTAPFSGTVFEAVYAVFGAGGDTSASPMTGLLPRLYTTRNNLIPTSIFIPQPDGTTRQYPAFTFMDTVAVGAQNPTNLQITVLAADTDGDGIADAGYVRLPVGQIEGAAYYGAVRIIDNLAAINASVAMEPFATQANGNLPATPVVTNKTVAGDFFPSNIDLADLIFSGGDNPQQLNLYRFQAPGAAPFGENFNATPIDDSAVKHTDLVFNTPYEAAWTQLGSRLNNPGANTNATSTGKFRAIPLDEGMNMAYHFCLVNQNSAAKSTVLETALPLSTYTNPAVNHAPYMPDAPNPRYNGSAPTTINNLWYNQIFNYSAGNMPLRPMLVVRNPVSSFVPSYFRDEGIFGNAPLSGGNTYFFGDRVMANDPLGLPPGHRRGFVCIRQHTVGTQGVINANGSGYNDAFWAPMPWTNHPTKINANTANFGQLLTAYWSVMQDSPDGSNLYPNYSTTGVNWRNDTIDPVTLKPKARSDAAPAMSQFRNPIRGGNIALTRTQVQQLRAALAAVNTIDMRDGDEDVTSRTVALTDITGSLASPHTVYADVFGSEKQPYITQLMVDYEKDNTPPTAPYVVIELYNPHPTPIPLQGWKLASLTGQGSNVILTEVGDLAATLNGGNPTAHVPFINPGERIVISNKETPPQTLVTAWNAKTPPVKPFISKTSPLTAANLETAIGHELVLLRPRIVGALSTPQANLDNVINEGTVAQPVWAGMVPLDSMDLVGVAPDADPSHNSRRFRYARANLISTDPSQTAAWHCVYPGPYDVTGKLFPGSVHMLGLVEVSAGYTDPSSGKSYPPDNGNFGYPVQKYKTVPIKQNETPDLDQSQRATYETRPLQIANRDFAGPNRPYVDLPGTGAAPNGNVGPASPVIGGLPMSYPYGGFARSGDLLDVPFIGAYCIHSAATGGTTYAMNSVVMDSVEAQFQPPSTNTTLTTGAYDTDTSLGTPLAFHNEMIGHFCPMDAGSSDFIDDPTDTANFTAAFSNWTYHWAKRLFDYVDVHTPQDGFLPNIDPAMNPTSGHSGDPTYAGTGPGSGKIKYPGRTGPTSPQGGRFPYPVSDTPNLSHANIQTQGGTQQFQGLQDSAGTEGLININTANAAVLSAVPFFTPGEDKTPNGSYKGYLIDNVRMAQAIVTWRDNPNFNNYYPYAGAGPFRTIFDLMKVPGSKTFFHQFWITQNGSPGEVTNQYGDLSPFAPNMTNVTLPNVPETDLTDHVFGDVKTRFLGLMRISNLITTRSDSFTVYAQVQGWQNVGTAIPSLVATRRAAMLVDRCQVMPVRNASTGVVSLTPMGVTNVPND